MEKYFCFRIVRVSFSFRKVIKDQECLLLEEFCVYLVCLGNYEMIKLQELKKLLIEKDKKIFRSLYYSFQKIMIKQIQNIGFF